MKRLPTVSKAKKEIEFLQDYVFLAETYQPGSLQEQIIQLYAFTGSIQKVTDQLNAERAQEKLLPIDSKVVTEVIQSRPMDPLHKLVRTNYLNKTRPARQLSKMYAKW